jgi:hypothetical protein
MTCLSFGVPVVIGRWKQRNARRLQSVSSIFATCVPGAAWKRSAPLQTKCAELMRLALRELLGGHLAGLRVPGGLDHHHESHLRSAGARQTARQCQPSLQDISRFRFFMGEPRSRRCR